MFISLFFILLIVEGYRPIYHNDKKLLPVVYNRSIEDGNEISQKIIEIDDLKNKTLSETPMTNEMKTFIIGYSIRKKIFDEVANNDDIIKTFDNFNPLYVVLLVTSMV